jgi:SPX domain protein involved in polyphosphate accumulation
MRFGKTLRESVYPQWKEEYMDYAKLKSMLRENASEDDDVPWTEEDENRFCEEAFNVQLDKVSQFQAKTASSLQQRADTAFEKLRDLAPSDDKPKAQTDLTDSHLRELRAELDAIVNEVKELKRYSNLNYTGFLKIAKKHDRKRGDRYRVRPMMRVSLAEHGLNSEQGYSPLLNKLSLMYYAINQTLDKDSQQQPLDLEHQEEVHNGERYTAHKCKLGKMPFSRFRKLTKTVQSGCILTTYSRLKPRSCDISRPWCTASNPPRTWTGMKTLK